MRDRRRPLLSRYSVPLVFLLLVQWQPAAWGHGMHLQAGTAKTEVGWVIKGQLSYSDDSAAAGNYIQVENLSRPDFPALALQTREDGSFQLPGLPGDRYRVSAHGDEGHTTETEFVFAPPVAEGGQHDDGWPVYVILALLLLASLLPAYWLRERPGRPE
ncbi:carboxypeptidase regulatory-like domain-containing protein [Parahaliea aestuarii]|uniref:Carboxypeptidase regulatory-like domain-containing protein n=1 Tax=Parahaliea aestuarii TaxID=1852021 RepID=A0A5C8ZY01_9GAMM|nr:carboxypeptidase regulatory-like domain-containing protein [Parahaliea aestuarii]TXS92472.1 carboxypeptidase regulatory-like domain-containing protein [Parahaliea aestuarii]